MVRISAGSSGGWVVAAALMVAGLSFHGVASGQDGGRDEVGQAPLEATGDPGAAHESAPVDEPKRPRPGDIVRFIFASGDTAEGEIVSVEDDRYRVMIGGLEVGVAFTDVEDAIVLPSVGERFRQMRALVDASDAEAMSALANWAFERGLYDESMGLIDEALAEAPNDIDLKRLREMLGAQIELAKMRRRQEAEQRMESLLNPEEREEGHAARMPRPYPNFPLLTDGQVNLIKVFEVDLKHPPRILIERDTIDGLLSDYAENPLIPTTREGREAFRHRSSAEILGVMFRVQARELYPEVRIVGHPESMRAFRDNVHAGWLINNCATNRCHGGEDARDFILFNRKPSASRSFYTNFLIIDRYRTADGVPLIDYQEPDRSLLLQMGLAREDAETPHPDVEYWKPTFRSRDSRGFRRAVRWIEMMYRPRPEYPIEYVPPGRGEAAPEETAPEERVVR